jgi:hypothetical protein
VSPSRYLDYYVRNAVPVTPTITPALAGGQRSRYTDYYARTDAAPAAPRAVVRRRTGYVDYYASEAEKKAGATATPALARQ